MMRLIVFYYYDSNRATVHLYRKVDYLVRMNVKELLLIYDFVLVHNFDECMIKWMMMTKHQQW